jgi:hypothetical protein
MFKKPKINRQNKFLGLDPENDSEKQIITNNDENNNLNLSEKLKIESSNVNINQNNSSPQKIFEDSKNIFANNFNSSETLNENITKNIISNSSDNTKFNLLSEQKEAIKKMLHKNSTNKAEKKEDEVNLPLNENSNIDLTNSYNYTQNEALDYSDQIKKIKEAIDKKTQKPKSRGIIIKPLEKVLTTFYKTEENSDPGIKKIFISEYDLKNTKNPEDLKKLMGINKEEIDKEKKSKLQKMLDHQKDLFTLPEDLRVTPETKNDYVDNLIKLSAAGLIEVPLSLENKLKNIEETEIMKKQIIDKRLVEELDYLKVLKKLGPSYAKGYKNDLSRKKLTKLNNVFGNVFVNLNGRKRKLLREKMMLDNRLNEEGYIRQKEDVHSEKNSSNGEDIEEKEDNNNDINEKIN